MKPDSYAFGDHINIGPNAARAGLSDQEQELLESPEEFKKYIAKLHTRMITHAENLEFEEAAALRDQIHKLEQVELGLAS